MRVALDSETGEIGVEVVGGRAHDGVTPLELGADRVMIPQVELDWSQAAPHPRFEKLSQMLDVEVGNPDRRNIIILKEIKGAGRALQARAEYEHAHWCIERVEPTLAGEI